MTQNIEFKNIYILILISVFFFFLGNNLIALTDPDEVFYSLTAKEMLLRHEWFTPYIFGSPQFEKPIFTYWLLIGAFKVWGITPWAARLFPALFATFSVVGVYILAFILYRDNQRAFWAGLILATSAFFVGMGKTVFTDMIFATLILYSILSFYTGYAYPKYRITGILLFYLFGALAALTKGPLGLFIPEMVIVGFLFYRRRLDVLATPWMLVGFLLALGVALPWYVYMFKTYGNAFVHEFFYNDHWRRIIEAEHRANDRWYFYPLSMILGIFPFSLFLIMAIKDWFKRGINFLEESDHLILVWILVVFIIFQCAHSKLVSYILPLFPALAILTAGVLAKRISQRIMFINAGVLILMGVAIIIARYVLLKKVYVPIYPMYWLSTLLITLGAVIYWCVIKGRERLSVYVLSGTLMVVLVGAWLAKEDIEFQASCAPVGVYLPAKLSEGQRVLTSKPYARGISFYTDLPVAVYDPGGKGYFSPHPIPSFSNDKQLGVFLESQLLTYAYLKHSGCEHVKNNFKEQYKITLIKEFGTNCLLRIEPLTHGRQSNQRKFNTKG